MNKRLGGKGYIRGEEGHFLTSTGDLYRYHDGVLTLEVAWPSPSPEPNQPTKPQGVIEMSDYLGTFELQPLYDSHKSFYGKAFVERWDTKHGTQLVLKSYGTVVAKVTPTYSDEDITTYAVEIGIGYLSATTLRHVKEFLAQIDDTFHGVTLSWLRKAVRDGNPIDGVGTAWHKVYVLIEL